MEAIEVTLLEKYCPAKNVSSRAHSEASNYANSTNDDETSSSSPSNQQPIDFLNVSPRGGSKIHS